MHTPDLELPGGTVAIWLRRPINMGVNDKVFVADVLELYPDLNQFILQHESDLQSQTEHLVLDASAFTPTVQHALVKDCHFDIIGFVDREGKPKNPWAQAEALMTRIRATALDTSSEDRIGGHD